MMKMLVDKKWSMSEKDKQYVLSALQYFTKSDDVIPDDIPVVGFLDDCIVIDIVTEKITDQLELYDAFSNASKIYSCNDEYYGVNDWKETKRKELYSRMRHRRGRYSKSNRTRGTSFSII